MNSYYTESERKSTISRKTSIFNIKDRISNKKRENFESKAENAKFIIKQIFRMRGYKYDEHYKLYYVDLKTIEGEIFTFEAGFDNKEVLVCIHGFGTTLANYYQMLPNLAEHFHVFAFDMYGMGCSSRVKFDFKNQEEAHYVMLKSIEEWRQALGIEKFYLLGHSLGGYISVHYVNKYQPQVKGLFLMSPAGCTQLPDEVETKFYENRSFLQKSMTKYLIKLIEDKHFDLTKLIKLFGIRRLAKKFFHVHADKFTDQEMELLIQYPESILALEPSGHKVLGHFLKLCRYSKTPFGDLLPE